MEQIYHVKSDVVNFLYFEVEVDYLHDSTKLIFGYTDYSNLDKIDDSIFPGKIEKSIGINIKNGEIYKDGNKEYKFDFLKKIKENYNLDDSQYFDFNGCFFGIGVSLKSKEFFFTFNGRILNSLSYQASGEIRYQVYNQIKNDMLDQEEMIHKTKNIKTLANKINLEKEYKKEFKNKPVFKSTFSDYVPIIYVNGVSRFFVNIGGNAFAVKERHVRTGLIKKNLKFN
jgi:hypothetical protein